jgi:cytidylate kinase
MIIAIDGTAASGKGTLGRLLAAKYGYGYLDTGKIYRYVGLEAKRQKLSEADTEKLVSIVNGVTLEKLSNPELNSAEASTLAAKYSPVQAMRLAALSFQRNLANTPPGMVLDGRDIGTVVLPTADVKIFVDAEPEIRAGRRYKELSAIYPGVIYEDVLNDLLARDLRDKNRAVAPLKPATDAYLLDTSRLNIDAAYEAAVAIIEAARQGRKCG